MQLQIHGLNRGRFENYIRMYQQIGQKMLSEKFLCNQLTELAGAENPNLRVLKQNIR